MTEPDFRDLETKGFVLIRSFLSEAEVRQCREDFSLQPVDRSNRNYGLSGASGAANERLKGRVQQVLDRVNLETDLRPNLPLGASYFAVGRGIKFDWHQDHESFFATQNHYDYLNFYIPIVKPQREKSNLCIIPFDVLSKASPQTFKRVVRGGAARFSRLRSLRLLFLDETGSVHRVEIDIDDIAYTPELDAGDLLLMRGDMIHRTQDADTDRVSLSFRVSNAQTLVSRSRLVRGGWLKALMMLNNIRAYERLFQAFDEAGRESVPMLELLERQEGMVVSKPKRVRHFLKFLLAQKLREGVLFRFLKTTVTGVVAVYLVNLDDHFRRKRAPAAHRKPQAA